MARTTKLAYTLASALLLLLAFPPVNLALLVFVALAPFFVALRDASRKEATQLGFLFGLVYMGGQFTFLYQFVERWTGKPMLALLPALVASLITALYFIGLAHVIRLAWLHRWVWAIPLIWAGVEVIRSLIPGLAFPWALLHTPLWRLPALIQTAGFGTAFFVSAMLALSNLCFAMMLAKEPFKRIRLYLLTLLLLLGYSASQYNAPYSGDRFVVSIGQLGFDMAFTTEEQEQANVSRVVPALIAQAEQHDSDLLVLPEGLVEGGSTIPPAMRFAVPSSLPIMFGGARGDEPRYQSAFAHENGKWTYADKRRLVVFGEYVPLRNQLPFLQNFNMPAGDLSPGERTQAISIAGKTVGPLVCFEGLFPDVAHDQVANGAELLAVLSIDDWYMETAAPEQLAASAVFRAVESDLPVVRSASLGHSLAIDQRGNIIAHARPGVQEVLRVDLLVKKSDRPLAMFWIFPSLAVLTVFAVPMAHLWLLWRWPAPKEPVEPQKSS
jgi:apolipoprotein N-acyltransferase